jgi:hypothetical protein
MFQELKPFHTSLLTSSQNVSKTEGLGFSTDWACISYASNVLGVCEMITSALLRAVTER